MALEAAGSNPVIHPNFRSWFPPGRAPRAFATVKAMDQLEGARVLLVDDSPCVRKDLGKQLDGAGAEVTAVGSAAEALAALREGAFDVMVCDLWLPGTDGHSLMRAVRGQGGTNAGIRAVAITARADEESRSRARESGFDDYLPKLVSALLVPTVARLRDPRRAPRARTTVR